jgi:hypothetical protein
MKNEDTYMMLDGKIYNREEGIYYSTLEEAMDALNALDRTLKSVERCL